METMRDIKYLVLRKIAEYLSRFSGGPILIRINPSDRDCNLECRMCPLPKKRALLAKEAPGASGDKGLDAEDYVRLVNNLGFQTRYVEIVGGGEPLLFPGIEKIMAAIKKNHISGRLITNGTLLRGNLNKLLVAIGWDFIRISLNAASRDSYIKTMGRDCYDSVLDNIRQLIEARGSRRRPHIALHFVIQKSNFEDIVKFATLAKQIKADDFQYDSLMGQRLGFEDVEPDGTQRYRIIALLQEVFGKYSRKDIILRYQRDGADKKPVSRRSYLADKYCLGVQFKMEIRSDGNVVPCCMVDNMPEMMNIRDYSLRDIWQAYKNFRDDLAVGKFRNYCYNVCNYELPKRNKDS